MTWHEFGDENKNASTLSVIFSEWSLNSMKCFHIEVVPERKRCALPGDRKMFLDMTYNMLHYLAKCIFLQIILSVTRTIKDYWFDQPCEQMRPHKKIYIKIFSSKSLYMSKRSCNNNIWQLPIKILFLLRKISCTN